MTSQNIKRKRTYAEDLDDNQSDKDSYDVSTANDIFSWEVDLYLTDIKVLFTDIIELNKDKFKELTLLLKKANMVNDTILDMYKSDHPQSSYKSLNKSVKSARESII